MNEPLVKPKFKLSRFNNIYCGIVVGLVLISFLVTAFESPEKLPFLLGYRTVNLALLILLPMGAAWLVWSLSGKKERGGTATFNIVLTLVLLGHIAHTAQLQQAARESHESLAVLEQKKAKLKKDIAGTTDPKDLQAAQNDYVESVKDEFGRLADSGAGPGPQFFKIMSEYVTESQRIAREWQDAFLAAVAPEAVDYSLLNSDEAFASRRRALTLYVKKTDAYRAAMRNSGSNLKARLSVMGKGNEHARAAVKGAQDAFQRQMPVLEPLMEAHLGIGRTMLEILDRLEKNRGRWTVQEGVVVFDSNSTVEEFNVLNESLRKYEETMEALSNKMMQEL